VPPPRFRLENAPWLMPPSRRLRPQRRSGTASKNHSIATPSGGMLELIVRPLRASREPARRRAGWKRLGILAEIRKWRRVGEQGGGLAISVTSTRRFAVLAEGALGVFSAKTAVGLLRYRGPEVVAVIDSKAVGRSLGQVLGFEHPAPIVGSLAAALEHRPDALLLGIAPRGGGLPAPWRAVIRDAIAAGLEVVSGLHLFLADDPEFAALAAARGTRLVDLRRPPEGLPLPREAGAAPPHPRPFVLLTVGSDCNVGKMTAALEITRAANALGIDAAFGATGQTGILLAGRGIAVDRVIADFIAGATERVIDELGPVAWAVVEGQGSLLHPAYSGVTLGLLHGARPDAMILCHHVGRTRIDGYGVPLPPLPALVRLYESAAAWVQPAPVVGLALNGVGAPRGALEALAAEFEAETGLPAVDPMRGAERLVAAAAAAKRRREAQGEPERSGAR
jgi:uncharacterized NAD-dependent epimerase/dehydratase family protein